MTSALNCLRELRRHLKTVEGIGISPRSEVYTDRTEISNFGKSLNLTSEFEDSKDVLQIFKHETWGLFGQYLSLKFCAYPSAEKQDQMPSDKIVNDVSKCGFFGESKKIDSMIVA